MLIEPGGYRSAVPARPFRFAAQMASAGSAREWADKARQAESLG
jgi:hypothetical protein